MQKYVILDYQAETLMTHTSNSSSSANGTIAWQSPEEIYAEEDMMKNAMCTRSLLLCMKF